MLYRRRIAGLLLAGAMVGGLTLAALPASATTNYYEIFSGVGTILCLQPAGGSGDAGTPIVQEPCNTANPAQNWAPAGLGGSSYEFVNQQTGDCLDARGKNVNHTPVQEWPCTGISNEHWSWPHSFPSAFWPIGSQVSGSSGFCLDDLGAGQRAGAGVQIYSCDGTSDQAWAIAGPVPG
jgi:hypothetical protein